jgi:nitrogen fixation NifU-like protein
MTSEHKLYSETIREHSNNPRKTKKLNNATLEDKRSNPLCGDEVSIALITKDETIQDISVITEGCSISIASGSLMAESIAGQKIHQVKDLILQIRNLLEDDKKITFDKNFKTLQALESIRNYPVRIKCAMLPWNTLENLLIHPASG